MLPLSVPENEYLRDKYGDETYASWPDPHAVESPFTSEKDLMDNQVGIMEFRNGIKVQFQATMCNAIPERRMFFSCTEGTMIVELYSGSLQYRQVGDDSTTVVDIAGDGHGGGDTYIMKELYDTMVNATPPRCSGNEGLESAVTALAMDQSARTHSLVDLEPIWKQLNR